MKKQFIPLSLAALILATLFLTSCEIDDPGPLQYGERTFTLTDFNRLEMGSGYTIIVRQGAEFSIKASGDVRNLDDLVAFKSSNTLIIQYDHQANRKHATTIRITMPSLKGVNFSGGSISDIQGFESEEEFEMILSGGSLSKLYPGYTQVKLNLSGASKLDILGSGIKLNANISGASDLKAYDFPVKEAQLDVSGQA